MKQLILILFLIAVGLGVYVFLRPKKAMDTPFVVIGNKKYMVEIAETDTQRTQGLSGRDRLSDNSGMLFVFSSPDKYRFWMKDMKFPLDFIWVRDGKIVDLTENVPPPGNSEILPTIKPNEPVSQVLEVMGGEITRNSFFIGQSVEIIN